MGDAGWPHGHPTTINNYKKALRMGMEALTQVANESSRHINILYRSTHYNPIGDRIGSCPPSDWRSPPIIDLYNGVMERVCQEYGLPYIDTTDIMGILWDRAEDWCHYRDVSSEMEYLYIMDRIF